VEESRQEPVNSTRRAILGFVGVAAAGSALAGSVKAQVPSQSATAVPGGSVSGPLRSAGALAFGPDNVLFVGDITGVAVHAFALRATDVTSQADVELGNFHNFEGRDLGRGLDQKLAALLGSTYDNIVINDMVVHQPSQQIFISVERGRSTDALPAILKVNHGQLEILELDGIPHTQVGIPDEPGPDAMLEFDTQRPFAITDVKYYDREIYNKPVVSHREQTFAILLVSAWELLLKARLLREAGNRLQAIYETTPVKREDGSTSKRVATKTNRAGNPVTIALGTAMPIKLPENLLRIL